MSYSANQYNYATPLSSAPDLVNGTSAVQDKKYFTLFNNTLDGRYYPVTGDVGIWGNVVADEKGYLSTPFVLTVTENASIRAFRMVSSEDCYPLNFTVDFYNGDTHLFGIARRAEANPAYPDQIPTFIGGSDFTNYLPIALDVTHYTIKVTRVSASGGIARIYDIYYADTLLRTDALSFACEEQAVVGLLIHRVDTLKMNAAEKQSYVQNTIEVSDTAVPMCTETSELLNIHTVMKEPTRRIYGKVYVTYTDPMLDSETKITSNSVAHNSDMSQLLNGETEQTYTNYFTLYENNLTGAYIVNGPESQIGWVSAALSGADGSFSEPPYVCISFAARPLVNLSIAFDASRDNLVTDFVVTVYFEDNTSKSFAYNNNNNQAVVTVIDEQVNSAIALEISVLKVAKAGMPAIITDVPLSSTVVYNGYHADSRLMSIDLLEELTYEDEVEALGGVSANEVTVVIDNSNKEFYFNNRSSIVASQLKRNRKIVPWLGAEVLPGEVEWYPLGTFWSYKWEVPVGGLKATVVAFDTIGLLGATSFMNHQVLIDTSIGELIEYVLEDAKTLLSFIEYDIDASLYDIKIPYAWFELDNHAAALRKISGCYPMHIYCDRNGVICAKPQKLRLDYYYDIWADNTNVVDKTYSSLYTALPNLVNVSIVHAIEESNVSLTDGTTAFEVDGTTEKTLTFSQPYLADCVVTVDCDASVSYTYETYSWGIVLTFTGTGTVRSINCTGTAVNTATTSTLTKRNDISIRVNGAVTRDITSDFIQTSDLATTIINRIFSLSENDKYDVTVNYRGDIALSINDPVLLLDGIAPDNRYNIKRHQLSWNGALTGSADLNT